MMTVKEVSDISGVSIRALHYYDALGLLHPAITTQAGYRMYDESSLRRLQSLLLFRELGFPLNDIRAMLDHPGTDTEAAIDTQIGLLKLKRDRIDRMIAFADSLKKTGVNRMDFSAFDTKKQEEYKRQAKERWGNTAAFREFSAKDLKTEEIMDKNARLMCLLGEFGTLRDGAPEAPEVQALVGRLQAFITENFYHCTNEILAGLGMMYADGGEFTASIDAAGGTGTANFASRAIACYCAR